MTCSQIGAGIGGLTAAIAIARGGAKVTVLEAAPELGEIGAGIQVCRFRIAPVRDSRNQATGLMPY